MYHSITMFSLFLLRSHLAIMHITSSHTTKQEKSCHCIAKPFHINAGKETSYRRGALRNVISCSKLNWDHGQVNCGASSFVGV